MTRSAVVAGWVTASVLLAACETASPPPDDVVGTWVTDARGYEGRTMRIAADSVWFGTGDGGETGHAVRGVRVDGPQVVIEYGDRGREYQLALLAAADGTLALGNRPEVRWRRSDR